jgi:ABC-type Fe3+-hydroxamate transport system substrate-binding protein
VSRTVTDDLGTTVVVPDVVGRVVSLVPSLTESIAATAADLLVGATQWCAHPADLDVTRVGGTKNPRLDDIVSLQPDVVIANDEENRDPDIAQLRARGVAVWVTGPRTVADALTSLDRMLTDCCGLGRPAWLDAAATVWSAAADEPGPRMSAVVPIWRRPWMVLGSDTFAGDLLSRLDIDNVMASSGDRYPKVSLRAVRDREPDIVLLPDEPYKFAWEDGPEAFAGWGIPVACISGRHLTWYGPSLVTAREVLLDQIAEARLPSS